MESIIFIVAGLIVLIIQICLIVAILQLPGLLKTLIQEVKKLRAQTHNDAVGITETIAGQEAGADDGE